VKLARQVVLSKKVHSGAQPRVDIFDRPVLRDADKNSPMEAFPSALQAVQELSFGSTSVRHVNNEIDDILIANNIAYNADGNNAESYGFVWFWDKDELKEKAAKEKEPGAAPEGRSIMAIAMGLPNFCGCDTTS